MKEVKKISIIHPQFKREDGKNVIMPGKTKKWFQSLKTMRKKELRELGMRQWDDGGLWLFPMEWYNSIPENLTVTDISYTDEKFKNGVSDNDSRFGCLPYGFVIK